jgi:hypothetical protein
VFDQQARGSREIWWNPVTRVRTTVPQHPGDLPGGNGSRAIVKQVGLTVEEFLRLWRHVWGLLDHDPCEVVAATTLV